jgi:hypothetical protein
VPAVLAFILAGIVSASPALAGDALAAGAFPALLLVWQPLLWLSGESPSAVTIGLLAADLCALVAVNQPSAESLFSRRSGLTALFADRALQHALNTQKGRVMKSLRLLLCALPLALTGCSTMSSVNWSAAYPWNWFGSSMEVTEQGVGKLTASTPLNEQAISDALGSSYRLRSGMKTANGNIVRYLKR